MNKSWKLDMPVKACISPTLSRLSQNRFGFILPHVASLANCSHPNTLQPLDPQEPQNPPEGRNLELRNCGLCLQALPQATPCRNGQAARPLSHSVAGLLNCSLFPDRVQVAVRAGKANRSQLGRGGHKGKQTAGNRYNECVRRQAGNSSAVAAV